MKRTFLFVALLLIFSGAALAKKGPKNIIIMIGDGMGINQVQAAYTSNGGYLNMTDRCPYSGLRRTNSASDYITDSAAGGTAIATGVKTKNNMVGMSPDTVPLNSIIRLATLKGLSTGVIATHSVTDATPASFVAHRPHRFMHEEIAADYLASDITLFIGGGKMHFEKRKDGRDISEELRAKGYEIVYSLEEARKTTGDKLGALIAEDAVEPASRRDPDLLADATQLAIDKLSSNKKGFVLMVEGSQIDKGGHKNDQNYMISETLDFDRAVGKALDFAQKDKKYACPDYRRPRNRRSNRCRRTLWQEKSGRKIQYRMAYRIACALFRLRARSRTLLRIQRQYSSFYLMKDLLKLK